VIGAGIQGPANRFDKKPRGGRLYEHLRAGPISLQLIDGGVSRIEDDPNPSPPQFAGRWENFLIPEADIEHGGR
jgi:hypothetical protein